MAALSPGRPDHEPPPDEPPALQETSPSENLDERLHTRRAQVMRLRRELLVGDLVATVALATVSEHGGRAIVAAASFALLVTVTLVVGTADSPRSMIALRPVLRSALLMGGLGAAGSALLGSAAVGRELLLGAAWGAVALAGVRLLVRLPGSGERYGLGRRVRLLVGEPSALESRPTRRHNPLRGPEEIVVVTRAERPLVEATTGKVLRADSAGDDQRRVRDETRVLSGVVARVVGTALDAGAERVTVVPSPTWGRRQLQELSWTLEGTGIDMVIATALDGIAPHRAEVTQQDGRLVIKVGSASPRGSRAVAKSVVDRCVAAVLIVLLLPLLLGIGMAIRLDSAGPAIFRQTRVRAGSRTFTMYKFRTMRMHAEQELSALRARSLHDGPLFKMEKDPRVTRLGHLLRRTSLDELPQLLNVVKGEMSLVGPRPALPVEVATYDFVARRRLAVKPGMTGLWQVSGRSLLNWDESIGYDLDYVDNWSPLADASIAVRTVRAVIRKNGAF